METFTNPYTNDTIVLQQRVHNPNLWEMHQNGEWIGAADYHDLLVTKLERNGFVAQSQPEPTVNEWERRNNEACAQWEATFTEIARDYSARKRALANKTLKDRISKQGYEEAARIEADNKAALDAATLAYYAAISEPAKEEFASVVIPPDAFGALPASDYATIETAIWDEEVIAEDPEMAAKKCLLCGQPITDEDRTVNGRTIHEACYLAQFEKPKPALDAAYWAEYARNNPPQQYAPTFGWANPDGN